MKTRIINKVFKIYFTGILIALIGLISCDPFDCGGPYPDKFKSVDMGAQSFRYHFADTFGFCFEKLEYSSDTIDFYNWGINMTSEIEYYYSMIVKPNLNFPIGYAYACDPAPAQPSETIVSFKICCNKDFDQNHPAGTDLSDIFDAVIPLTFLPSAYKNCGNKKELQNLDMFFKENPFLFKYLDIVLNSPPAKSDSYTFIIEYIQDGVDVDRLDLELQTVFLKP